MKIVSYPLASFSKSLELSKTVSDLGGNCAHSTCAAKMNKKISGAFTDLISATVKYGLISNKKGTLTLTDSYKEYKLSYDQEEEKKHLRELFLKPQLFQEIFEKYKNVPLPIDILEKALIKEFGVPEKHASRTANHFINGARSVGLLGENNIFVSTSLQDVQLPPRKENETQPKTASQFDDIPTSQNGKYSIQVLGPDIDTKVSIVGESDFLMVNAILNNVKSKLNLIKKEDDKDANPKPAD